MFSLRCAVMHDKMMAFRRGFCLSAFVFGILVIPLVYADKSREDAIRKSVKANLHFSAHCLCRAITNETIPAVLKTVSLSDIPALINLLDDEGVTKYGAEKVLVSFGDAALPELKKTISRNDGKHAAAVYVVALIADAKK